MTSQLIFNAVAQGSAYSLVSIPLALLFRQRRFFDFSLGGVFTVCAYLCVILQRAAVRSVPVWILCAAASGAICALVIEAAVFGPLRGRGSGAGASLLASFAILISCNAFVALVFGNETLILRDVSHPASGVLWGARFSLAQILEIATAVGVITVLIYFFRRTRIGWMVRAVSSDEELASVVGIHVSVLRLTLPAAAGAVAGIGGALAGLDVDLAPNMSLSPLFCAFAGAVVGGAGSVRGAALGCLALGLTRSAAVLFLPVQWHDTLVFSILVGCLLFRPQGLLRTPTRLTMV